MIAVGGMDNIVGAQLTLSGTHKVWWAVLDRNCGAVFKNTRAGRLSGIGQTQRVAQRMKMPRAPINDPARIARGFDEICEICFVEACNVFIAIILGQIIRFCVTAGPVLCAEVCFGDSGLIASLGRVAGHQVPCQRLGGLSHVPKLMRRIMSQHLLKRLLTLVVPRADLPTIATRSAKANPMSIQHDDTIALLRQMQRARQSGEARTNDADIAGYHVVQCRSCRLLWDAVGIPTGGIAA